MTRSPHSVLSRLKKLAPTLAAAALIFAPLTPALAAPSSANQPAVTNAVAYLATQQNTDGSITGFPGVSHWSAIALAAAGTDPATFTKPGGQSLLHYLQANPPAASASASEWARDILAIVDAGANPYDFGGTNYVAGLKALYHDHQLGSTSYLNDDAFGLMALIAASTPATDPALADAASFIIAHQLSNGGFSYSATAGATSDVDDTAAVIVALTAALYYGITPAGQATALTNATIYLLGTQNADGGFPNDPLAPPEWGGPASNTSSTSWALMALTVLDQFDGTNGAKAQTYLRSIQNADGSFPYMAPGTGSTSSTADAITALAGETWLTNIYDGPIPEDPEGGETTPTPSPSVSPTPTPTTTPGSTGGNGNTPGSTNGNGSVLGSATTSPSPSPSPQPNGSVLGASLPVVGSTGNLIAFGVALTLSTLVGLVLYRSRRTNPHTSAHTK